MLPQLVPAWWCWWTSSRTQGPSAPSSSWGSAQKGVGQLRGAWGQSEAEGSGGQESFQDEEDLVVLPYIKECINFLTLPVQEC